MQADGSRALRALVAEMAQLGDGDLQAILDDLDGAGRSRLMELMEAFRAGDVATPDVAATSGLNAITPGDWLLARLRPEDPTGARMTPHALQALRRAALTAGWAEVPATPPRRPDHGGLRARLGLRP